MSFFQLSNKIIQFEYKLDPHSRFFKMFTFSYLSPILPEKWVSAEEDVASELDFCVFLCILLQSFLLTQVGVVGNSVWENIYIT